MLQKALFPHNFFHFLSVYVSHLHVCAEDFGPENDSGLWIAQK